MAPAARPVAITLRPTAAAWIDMEATLKPTRHRKGAGARSLSLLAWSLVTAVASLAACRAPGQEPVSITAHADRPDTRITIDADAERATIEIWSPSGVGSAEFTVSGPMPKQIVVQLHLRGLEQYTFSFGQTTVTAALSSRPSAVVQESVQLTGSEAGQALPIAADSPYWMSVEIVPTGNAPQTIPLAAGTIEAEAPQAYLDSDLAAFSISWIDFFR
jgi:hypothetical protein